MKSLLPHVIPSWIDPTCETYFITINCRERQTNQLAIVEVAEPIFETVRFRQESGLWWPYLFLLMPDHLHMLVSFRQSEKRLKTIVSKWKEWTAKALRIHWQPDFFAHRIRHDESRRAKADYILQNPVRKGLVAQWEAWPFVYFASGQMPVFTE